MQQPAVGRRKLYCSPSHRQLAYESRKVNERGTEYAIAALIEQLGAVDAAAAIEQLRRLRSA